MPIKKLFTALALGLGLTLALVWLLSDGLPIARAATIGVTTTNDDRVDNGNCTLREAIIAANTDAAVDACTAGTGADVITLATGTYVLTVTGTGEGAAATGDLDITQPLTITGLGPSQTIIDASGVISDRVLDIRPGAGTVVISGVAVMGGNVTGNGGGIYNWNADLTLINTVVMSNVADYNGGGVYVSEDSATLSVSSGQILSNTANYGGGVYVYNGSATLNGGQIASNTANYYGGGVYVSNGSAMLNGGQIASNTANYYGGGVHVSNGSAMLNGGQIISNTANYGGGMCVSYGNATLSDGQIVSNTAKHYGGGVYVWNSTAAFTQTGVSTITHNFANNGGGVYIRYGSATLSGGQIVSNTATNYGGGVYVDQGSATLSGGQIISNTANFGGGAYLSTWIAAFTQTGSSAIAYNTASASGGGIYILSGRVTLSAGRIHDNHSAVRGGGVEVVNSDAFLVQTGDSTIAHNHADTDGGGVVVVYGSATLEGGRIVSNTANDNGGGVYVSHSNGVFTQTGGGIVDNYAGDSGGGVYVKDGTAVLEGGQILSNTADYGGGVYVDQGNATSTQTGVSTIARNTATSDGGGIYNNAGTLTLVNTTVSYNTAGSDGGGLYDNAGTSVLAYTTIASNTASTGGGGIHRGVAGTVLVQNTIVAYNGPANCNGNMTSNGHNLDSGSTCGFNGADDQPNTDPLLGPLTADGGTLVHPLIVGSPAIDAGLCTAGVTTDQRGQPRPNPASPFCDVGAYEAEIPVITVTKSGPARFSPQDRITYTLYVTNTGTLTATHVVLTDTLPTGAAFVTASDDGVEASGVVTWPVFSVPPGDGLVTRTFAVTATATITNADYRVSCAGGISAAGSVVVVTEIRKHKIYLPLVLRNRQ